MEIINALAVPFGFGILAALVTALGLSLVMRLPNFTESFGNFASLIAAGMLVSLSFTHFLPEAMAGGEDVTLLILFGYLSGLLLRQGLSAAFPVREDGTNPSEIIAPMVAIGLHSFLDGGLYAVGFQESLASGLSTAIPLILHEVAEGAICFTLLIQHQFTRKHAFILAVFVAAVSTPLGVVMAGPILVNLGPESFAPIFAVSAGILIYVATGPLMAPLKNLHQKRAFVAVIIGAGLGIALHMLPLGDAHGHHHGHDHAHGTSHE